jgi:hypothetical protein
VEALQYHWKYATPRPALQKHASSVGAGRSNSEKFSASIPQGKALLEKLERRHVGRLLGEDLSSNNYFIG